MQKLKGQAVKGFVEVDHKIIDARISGISLFEYQLSELEDSFDFVLLKIAGISGIKIPFDAAFIQIIKEQVVKFLLNFGYDELNLSEIILAFELNCKIYLKYPVGIEISHIPICGEHINVDYVSQVLYNYMTIRNLLDRKLQNLIDGY